MVNLNNLNPGERIYPTFTAICEQPDLAQFKNKGLVVETVDVYTGCVYAADNGNSGCYVLYASDCYKIKENNKNNYKPNYKERILTLGTCPVNSIFRYRKDWWQKYLTNYIKHISTGQVVAITQVSRDNKCFYYSKKLTIEKFNVR